MTDQGRADDEVVQDVAFRFQSEWKPEYEKVVRTTLDVTRPPPPCEHEWVPIVDATVTAKPTNGRWCRKCFVTAFGPVALGKASPFGTATAEVQA